MTGPHHLEFPRNPSVGAVTRVGYFVVRVGDRVFGRRRMLRCLLDVARLTRRLAFEEAGRVYGHDFHSVAKGVTPEMLGAVLPSGGTVLDLGCGNGRWSREAAAVASRVVGVDHNADLIEEAKRLTDSPKVDYFAGDVADTPNGPFDVALVIHLLEHVADPVSLLNGLRGVARAILVEVPDFEADSLNVARLWAGRPFSSDGDHVREYTEQMLRSHLADAGWQSAAVFRRGGSVVAQALPANGSAE
ncbi:MAG: class I SAM-dependent methyltransferase [Acidimicrobiales bacterium]